jgi:hypothetical protein
MKRLTNFLCILSVVFLIANQGHAQRKVLGTVFDAAQNTPIEDCNVYISGSSKGSFTNNKGEFEIRDVKAGIYELVFSHVSFKTHVQVIEVKDKDVVVRAGLILNPTSLSEVVVFAEKDRASRRRDLRRFKDFFYGDNYLDSEISILNESAIVFKEAENGHVIAPSPFTLRVKNDHLGYDLDYHVKDFVLSGNTNMILGTTKFTEQQGKTASEELFLAENRQRAYNGSSRHFFNALINETLEKSGFEVYMSNLDPDMNPDELKEFYSSRNETNFKIKSDSLPLNFTIQTTEYDNIKKINFGGTLSVSYKNEFSNYGGIQNSKIKMVDTYVYVYNNGVILNPSALKTYGQWAVEGVYDALPFEFESNDSLVIIDNIERRDLLTNLSTITQNKPTEKIYLHTNRSEFFPNETLWFKAYVVAGPMHQPSPLSNNIYVDLIDEQNEVVKSLLLSSKNGFADGSMELDKKIKKGQYTLRAYTTAMKESDSEYFFRKSITIDPPKSSSDLASTGKLDVQFFPESGNLVDGLATKVAFKILDSQGMPVDTSGKVLDKNGNEIVSFKALHDGMGVFELTPNSTLGYQAKIDKDESVYNFPKVEKSGVLFNVDVLSDSANVLLNFKNSVKSTIDDMFIICQSRGWLNHTATVKFEAGTSSLSIPKSNFKGGINHITLFNDKGMPLAERLFFLHDSDGINIEMVLESDTFEPRGLTEVKIKATDKNGFPVQGNFSLSAYNLSKTYVQNANDNIVSNLLLNSDLKGYIHNPAYYFDQVSSEKKLELDLVMITHGWTRFKWEELAQLAKQSNEINYAERVDIHGKMTLASNGRPVKNGSISYINNESENPETLVATTDKDGNFVIENAMPFEKKSFIITGTSNNKKEIKINIDSTSNPLAVKSNYNELFFKEKVMTSVNPEADAVDQVETIISKNFTPTNFDASVRVLESVTVEALSEVEERKSIYGQPTFTFDLKPIAENNSKTNVFQNLQGRLPGVYVRNALFGKGNAVVVEIRSQTNVQPTLDIVNGDAIIDVIPSEDQPVFFLDNVQVTIDALLDIPMEVFDRVEVFKGPDAAIFSTNAARGAMLFFTKTGYSSFSRGGNNGSFSFALPNGYHVNKEFYTPKYAADEAKTRQADHRIAIHWHPNVVTDEKGESLVSFYNADDLDRIKIVLEGITIGGKPAVGSISYSINKSN